MTTTEERKKRREHLQDRKRKPADAEEAVAEEAVAEEAVAEEAEGQPHKDNVEEKSKKHQKKTLKYERKAKDPNFEVLFQAKRLWEQARTRKIQSQERKRLISDIVQLLDGKIAEVCLKHDASRMIQTCVRYGRQDVRDLIAKELSGSYYELAINKYGKFLLSMLLETCPVARKLAAADFKGKVAKLVKNKDASGIIDTLFSRYLSPQDKHAMISEFYGNEFIVFKESATLESVISNNPAKKPIIMEKIRSVLETVFQKENLHHSIVHRLMLDYVRWEDKKKLAEWMSSIHELLSEFVHTEEGAQVAVHCLAMSSTKERKAIIKSLKPSLLKIARGEHSHKLLLSIFEMVDDTKLVGRGVVEDLCSNLEAMLKNTSSRRCILFLLGGKSPFYVPEPTIALLDRVRPLDTGKKDAILRTQELRDYALKAVVDYCTESWQGLIRNSFLNGVLVETLATDQQNKVLHPLVARMCKEIAEPEEITPLLNFLKKLSRRAEEPLVARIFDALNANISAWVVPDAVDLFSQLGRHPSVKLAILKSLANGLPDSHSNGTVTQLLDLLQ